MGHVSSCSSSSEMFKSCGGSPVSGPSCRGSEEGGGGGGCVVEVVVVSPFRQYVFGVGKVGGIGVPSSRLENSISNSRRASSSAQWR